MISKFTSQEQQLEALSYASADLKEQARRLEAVLTRVEAELARVEAAREQLIVRERAVRAREELLGLV